LAFAPYRLSLRILLALEATAFEVCLEFFAIHFPSFRYFSSDGVSKEKTCITTAKMMIQVLILNLQECDLNGDTNRLE